MKLPEVKKKLSKFISSEEGKITKKSVIVLALALSSLDAHADSESHSWTKVDGTTAQHTSCHNSY